MAVRLPGARQSQREVPIPRGEDRRQAAGRVPFHRGCTSEEIIAELERWDMWPVQPDPGYKPPPEPELDAKAARTWERIVQIDNALVPAQGTLAEQYLRSRSIDLLHEHKIGYHPRLYHELDRTSWPAMVAAIRDVDGHLIGLARTYLRFKRPAKAPVDPPKLSLGSMRGGSVHLAPAGPTLVIGEGIETTLSVMQATGLPGWAALGNTNMVNVDLPEIVREVLIAADGDAPGERAANLAGDRWKREGKRVRIMRPPHGFDFNDVLRGLA